MHLVYAMNDKKSFKSAGVNEGKNEGRRFLQYHNEVYLVVHINT